MFKVGDYALCIRSESEAVGFSEEDSCYTKGRLYQVLDVLPIGYAPHAGIRTMDDNMERNIWSTEHFINLGPSPNLSKLEKLIYKISQTKGK